MMYAVRTFETSMKVYQALQRNIPRGSHLPEWMVNTKRYKLISDVAINECVCNLPIEWISGKGSGVVRVVDRRVRPRRGACP